METTTEPEFVALTLRWCNERRAEKGVEPLNRLPKGRRNNADSCPCGAATGLSVNVFNAYDRDGSERIYVLPRPVREFVRAFDVGRLPQYDEVA